MSSTTDKNMESIEPRHGPHGEVIRLRGKVWLSHALHLTDLSEAAFARRYYYDERRSQSGLIAKWRRGEVSPSMQSARRLERTCAGALATFNHPIFELLKNKPISAGRVWRLLTKLPSAPASAADRRSIRTDKLLPLCGIGYQAYRRKSRPLSTPLWVRPDSWQHRSQPSFDSLTKMIGLLRVVENPQYINQHFYWAQDVFRLLPASLQEPWLAPHLEAFIDLVEDVRSRIPGSTADFFTVDRDVLRKQLQWKGIKPLYQDGDPERDPIRLEFRGNDSATIPKVDLSDVMP